MVAVTVQNALHGFLHPAGRSGGEGADVGYFAPDQHAEPVRHLVIARVRHLDVAAQKVQPQRLGLVQLVFQKGDGRWRADGFGVVILIQRAAHVERCAVQVELAVSRLELAEPESVSGFIDIRAAIADLHPCLIKRGMVGRPGGDIRDRQDHSAAGSVRHLAPIGGDDRDRCGAARQRKHKADFPRGKVGADGCMAQMALVADLQRDRLPDAADRPVPALLAMRNLGKGEIRAGGGVAIRQQRCDFQQIIVLQQGGGDCRFKRQIAAFVGCDCYAVDPDRGVIGHRAKAQNRNLPRPRIGSGKMALIVAGARRLPQIGKLCLPRLRHLCLAPRAIAVPELPDAIKRQCGAQCHGDS